MVTIPQIDILARHDAQAILTDERADEYQSLISIGWMAYVEDREPKGFHAFRHPKIRLNLNDVPLPHMEGCCIREDIENLVAFVPEIKGRCLIHCQAGLSRSPAAALIAVATMMGGKGHEEEALAYFHEHLRGRPNVLMIAYADHVLGCEGHLYFPYLKQTYQNDHQELLDLYEQIKPT